MSHSGVGRAAKVKAAAQLMAAVALLMRLRACAVD